MRIRQAAKTLTLCILALLVGVTAGPLMGEPSAQHADDPASLSPRLVELAESYRAVTVGIIIPGGSMGSGVIVDDKGLVMTAAHVLPKPGEQVVIVLSDGRQLKGEALGVNPGIDSGFARITEDGEFPVAKVAEADTVWEGDWCIAFGHGGGVQTDRPAPMRLGRVLHVTSSSSSTRWITTDCTVISGDSGGPLFNLKGEVIGIHSNIGMSVLVNRHIPMSAFYAQWDQLTKPNTVNEPPKPAEPIIPGLDALPDDIEREIVRRLQDGDEALRKTLESKRDEQGRIALSPEFAAELFGRDDLLEELKVYQDRIAERERRSKEIENADAGGIDPNEQESAVSKQSQKTRMLILEKKRERMLGSIAEDLRSTHGKIAEHVLASFGPSVDMSGPVTAEVICRGEVVALGTVVREDGYIVTKASELVGPARVRLAGQEFSAMVVNGEGANDLALLKIPAQGLTPVRWADENPALGSMLVTPDADGGPLAMSIVGVDAREIPQRVNNLRIPAPPKPFLGVAKLSVEKDDKGIRVGSVEKDGPAAKAGLQADDLVTAINGDPVKDSKTFIGIINKTSPGDEITLSVVRGEETLELTVTLGKRPARQAAKPRDDRQSAAQVYSARGGKLSDRRTGFPLALTHDAVIWADAVGGPVLNLEGKAVGLNIARYGRTATYALPADHARQAIEAMMRGR